MKIDLFENKYKPSNALKIFFADVVCFLLVAIISVGVCYAYFSNSVSITGDASMAQVTVEYQALVDGNYQTVDYVSAIINPTESSTEDDAVSLNGTMITPGDTIKIVGRAMNTSTVSVYVLARLNIEVLRAGSASSTVETIWFYIGENDPGVANGGNGTPTIEDNEVKILTIAENGFYNVGAGSLGAARYKQLAITYTFSGADYQNGDVIKSVSLRLQVHQKDYLETADDYDLYTSVTNGGKTHSQSSVYAAHHITGHLVF